MRKFKLFLASAAILLSGFAALAQNITVKGTVSDESGEPIIAAGVVIDGTTKGTVTGANGEYTISVPANASLRFSSIGYKDQLIPVDGKAVINVTLAEDATKLEDAVIVAYGTVSKESLTGSVTTLKSDEIASAPVTSVDKMLAGKLAGVSVTQGSGQPGSTSTIRVRGTSSISAGNEPLWVVDGIPMMASDFRQISDVGVGGGSSSTFLNPNDIESITVLKDAAAASIYGSRAANGVILVTTKSGKSGRAKFTARAKYGVQQLANDNNLRPLTGLEALEYKRTAVINAGQDPDDPTGSMYFPYTLLENGASNWYKELTRIGSIQEYEVNATGGNDKSSYYSSLSYHKNVGVYNFLDFQRFTARVNADSQLTKSLKTGARVNVSYSDSHSPQMGNTYYINPQFAMWHPLPWHKVYNDDGSLNYDISEMSGTNPLGVGNDEYNDKDYRLQGSVYLEWKILPYLTFKTTDGVEFLLVDSRQYWSPNGSKLRGSTSTMAYSLFTNDIRYTTSNTLTFDKAFGEHHVRAMAGQEAMTETYKVLGGYSPGVDPNIPYHTTGTAASDEVEYSFSEETLLSYFGYAEYSFAHKYSIQATLRTDGSSLFGADTKWGTFYSVGGSWNIANEKFLKGLNGTVSQAKLRASYGVNGNNNIAAYRAYGTYASVQNNGAIGYAPSRSANPELSWELNKTWNVGLDFGFFDDRLTGSVDVYNRITDDMLLATQVPYTTGFGSNTKNVGSIQNKGVELLLDGVLFRKGDFTWTAGFNIAFNRSLVLDLAGNEFLTPSDSRIDDSTGVRITEGRSLYTFYLRDWYGVNPSNGDGLWWAEDGTLTNDRNKARYIYYGSPEPKATGGFNTNVTWRNWTLGAYFQFVTGNKVLSSNSYVDDGYSLTANTSNAALNYWKQPGDTGVTPKPVAQNPGVYHAGYSTRFLQDGSYLRIKDVTLSYDVPSKFTDAIKIKGARIYVSALNPYTFHNVTSLDPEAGPLGNIEVGVHTAVKSLIGGVEISF